VLTRYTKNTKCLSDSNVGQGAGDNNDPEEMALAKFENIMSTRKNHFSGKVESQSVKKKITHAFE